ncbi:hypothetical protein B0I35DRAFT_421327 [Stachybotrys elegans]|uniref:Essential protein Yae1 N-terminal domain-containing protein n=1 Tax=Stachybotrys elegans TaxID=80388 RepID=A0A8K0SXI5_9HYPO|nr:hypothetical protein B0I35DRAFT_421327 [Stachybotrys elegans]
MAADPLDDVFNLEDQFYQQGYQQGLADGVQAGKVEGRSFGMETGLDKFLESGRLASKAVVWANRARRTKGSGGDDDGCALPPLAAANARLDKNIGMLYALVEPDTLSTANTDEAVQDFDDRFKRAQGKAKIIERMVSTAGKDSPERDGVPRP